MRKRPLTAVLSIGLLLGTVFFLHAQTKDVPAREEGVASSRVDLKTETLVGKKLDRIEDGPNGKSYHYTYRVEAKATEKELPRYAVNPQYEVSHTKEGFRENDTVTLLSENTESATDSPVWVYEVAYVGSGERSLVFTTAGSTAAPMFMPVNSETEDPDDPGGSGGDEGGGTGSGAACECCTTQHMHENTCGSHALCPDGCKCTESGCTCPCHGQGLEEEPKEIAGVESSAVEKPCP